MKKFALSLVNFFVKIASRFTYMLVINPSISQNFSGIRKIHGHTDTRTLYTDLLFSIDFWKLEKYTDPLEKYTDPRILYTDLLF